MLWSVASFEDAAEADIDYDYDIDIDYIQLDVLVGGMKEQLDFDTNEEMLVYQARGIGNSLTRFSVKVRSSADVNTPLLTII
jgi:hypothetical protein